MANDKPDSTIEETEMAEDKSYRLDSGLLKVIVSRTETRTYTHEEIRASIDRLEAELADWQELMDQYDMLKGQG